MVFPIYTSLAKGDERKLMFRPEDEPLHKFFPGKFRKATLIKGIDPDPTKDILSLNDLDIARAAIDKMGPLIPPFEEMWIEYDFAHPIGSTRNNVPDGVGGAAFVLSQWDEEQQRHIVELAPYVRYADGTLVTCSIGMIFEIKRDGSVDVVNFGVRDPKLRYLFEQPVEWKTSWLISYPILYTIGLMNCRNVSMKTETYRSRSSSPKARKNEPKLTYHTIVLPQPRRRAGQTLGGSHAEPGIHKVRGHFKTYTAAAPLLGKHVGTFWWPWQVRGNADKGAIVSEYTVKEK